MAFDDQGRLTYETHANHNLITHMTQGQYYIFVYILPKYGQVIGDFDSK
jgi:hypothetical protein